jgi:phage tail-like protein
MKRPVFALLPIGLVLAVLAIATPWGESGPAASNVARSRGSRFAVLLQLEAVGIQAQFSEISGLGSETEVIEFREGGQNDVVHKIPGRLKYPDIVLKRGITTDASIWVWRKMVEDGNIQDARTNGKITLLDRGNAVATWSFQNAWPAKISGPELGGEGNEIALEEIVIVHEGMRRD